MSLFDSSSMLEFSLAALAIALFFGLRRFFWWYWGIDRVILALENIDESLRTLPTVRIHDQAMRRRPARAA